MTELNILLKLPVDFVTDTLAIGKIGICHHPRLSFLPRVAKFSRTYGWTVIVVSVIGMNREEAKEQKPIKWDLPLIS